MVLSVFTSVYKGLDASGNIDAACDHQLLMNRTLEKDDGVALLKAEAFVENKHWVVIVVLG